MKLSERDLTILHAALASVLHGNEDHWDDLSTFDIEYAGALLGRLESKVVWEERVEPDDDEELELDN